MNPQFFALPKVRFLLEELPWVFLPSRQPLPKPPKPKGLLLYPCVSLAEGYQIKNYVSRSLTFSAYLPHNFRTLKIPALHKPQKEPKQRPPIATGLRPTRCLFPYNLSPPK